MTKPLDDQRTIEGALRGALEGVVPNRIREAMDHAVFGGGGRVRPRVCLAIARAVGGAPSPLAVAAAAAVELLHCASLVHDDLPCFDDASMRRGRPSVVSAYGEATAVLVGDALIVTAFDTLGRVGASASVVLEVARAAGARSGLVSGQALELEDTSSVDVSAYHAAKTAALFEAAASLGASTMGASEAPFRALGRSLGLFYQLADDVADAFGDPSVLGKPTGRDAANMRPTAIRTTPKAAEARELLAARSARVLDAVPDCRGREELRTFLAFVLQSLIARSGVGAPDAATAREARATDGA